jgi:hypothetical protein
VGWQLLNACIRRLIPYRQATTRALRGAHPVLRLDGVGRMLQQYGLVLAGHAGEDPGVMPCGAAKTTPQRAARMMKFMIVVCLVRPDLSDVCVECNTEADAGQIASICKLVLFLNFISTDLHAVDTSENRESRRPLSCILNRVIPDVDRRPRC